MRNLLMILILSTILLGCRGKQVKRDSSLVVAETLVAEEKKECPKTETEKEPLIFIPHQDTAIETPIMEEIKTMRSDSISGNFNGRGKSQWVSCLNDVTVIHIGASPDITNYLKISGSDTPLLETMYYIGRLSNKGDLNNDGLDEIGFTLSAVSRHIHYYVYTFKGGKWRKLVEPIPVFDSWLDDENFEIISISPDKPGYVTIRASEWDEEIEWVKPVEKSVKIK